MWPGRNGKRTGYTVVHKHTHTNSHIHTHIYTSTHTKGFLARSQIRSYINTHTDTHTQLHTSAHTYTHTKGFLTRSQIRSYITTHTPFPLRSCGPPLPCTLAQATPGCVPCSSTPPTLHTHAPSMMSSPRVCGRWRTWDCLA